MSQPFIYIEREVVLRQVHALRDRIKLLACKSVSKNESSQVYNLVPYEDMRTMILTCEP